MKKYFLLFFLVCFPLCFQHPFFSTRTPFFSCWPRKKAWKKKKKRKKRRHLFSPFLPAQFPLTKFGERKRTRFKKISRKCLKNGKQSRYCAINISRKIQEFLERLLFPGYFFFWKNVNAHNFFFFVSRVRFIEFFFFVWEFTSSN